MRRLYGHMLHADLVLFAKDILHLEIGPHLVAWGDLVATTQRIAVNAARDHSKSTFFSYAYPIWRAWAEPGCEVYLFSKTLDQAAEFLDIILYGRANLRGMVDIPELQHLVPSTGTVGKRDPRARMNRTDVRLTNGSRIRVAGYGKAMRGRHPKYIVLDDPLNDEDMWSETTRRKNTEYFKSAITNMLPPDGQLIVVGCVTEDSWIPTSQGLRQIGALRPGERKAKQLDDLCISVHGRHGWRATSKFWNNGPGDTIKVTLASGHQLEGAARHPVLVMPESGVPEWRRLDALRKGDPVAVKLGAEAWGSAPAGLDVDHAYLLGLWAAEGSVEAPYRLTISNPDTPIKEWLLSWDRWHWTKRDECHTRCSSKELLDAFVRWGVVFAHAPQKRVPHSIMGGSRENAIAFLQGVFDGDGTTYRNSKMPQTSLATTSEGLARDVLVLLGNLGIHSRLVCKGVPKPSKLVQNPKHALWLVRQTGLDALRFIALPGYRLSRKLTDVALSVGTRTLLVPNQEQLIRTAMVTKPRRKRLGAGRPPFNITELLRGEITPERLELVARWYGQHGANPETCAQLMQNAKEAQSTRWEPVQSVEASTAFTVDFVMPEDHSFVSNGIVSHNTPYHMNDLYGFLRQNEMYTFVRYPAILKDIDGKERALFPWRWTLARLHEKKKEIGSVAFAREILCCKPGTLIETEHGAQPIEQVTVGTRVLTHTGRWQRVLRCMQHEHDGSLIRIKGSLHVTPNHPVLTQEGWLYADQLSTTDQVMFPIPTTRAEPKQALSLITDTRVSYLFTQDKSRVYARGSAAHLASGSVGKSGSKSVPVELSLTAGLLRLLGLWLAEGHVSNGKTIVWSFGLHEQDTLVRETIELIRDVLGLHAQVSVNEAGGVACVVVGNRLFADWLLREFGTGAANKHVPLWVRDLAPNLIWPLVLGYADGDGYVDASTSFRVSSVSQSLLVSMRYLLARCGIFSSLKQVSAARDGVIQGRAVKLRASWLLSVSGGGYTAFKTRQLPARTFSWSRLHTGCEQTPYAGPVFNIEVEHDNSYVADGVAVHNCQPVSDDISIFPSFLFPPCYDHKLTLKMSRADILRMGWTCFMGVDIARSASVSADFFVVFVVAKAPDGRHVIVDISRTKGLSFNAQLELMKSIAERYDPALIHIESNAAQQVYSDEMRRTTDLPVKEFVTLASNKYPLDRGVPSLRLLLESGKLVIPRGDERSRQITDAWIEECTQFGFIDGKMQGIGAHDDMVMGWWLAEEAVKAGGFSFTFGENSDDKSADDEMTGGGADGENWLDVLVGKDDGDARDDLDFGSLGSAKQTPAMMPGTF